MLNSPYLPKLNTAPQGYTGHTAVPYAPGMALLSPQQLTPRASDGSQVPYAPHMPVSPAMFSPGFQATAPQLRAPQTPGQASGYANNAMNARNRANYALAAPMPQAGPAPTGGHASITLADGRTISRDYAAPGMYNQSVSGGAPNLPPLAPTLSVPSGARSFSGYSPSDVAAIGIDRQAFAQRQNSRADQLTDSALSAPGFSQQQRNQDATQQAGIAQSTAQTGLINAQSQAVTQNAGVTAEQHKQLMQDHQKVVAERDQLLKQISTLQNQGVKNDQAGTRLGQADTRLGIAKSSLDERKRHNGFTEDNMGKTQTRLQGQADATAQSRNTQLQQNDRQAHDRALHERIGNLINSGKTYDEAYKMASESPEFAPQAVPNASVPPAAAAPVPNASPLHPDVSNAATQYGLKTTPDGTAVAPDGKRYRNLRIENGVLKGDPI